MISEPLDKRVIVIKDADLHWNWDSSTPTATLKSTNSDYAHTVKLDPFPCYSHDKDLVMELAAHCEKVFPLGFKPYYYILPMEEQSRTNGTALTQSIYSVKHSLKKAHPFDPVIYFSGKRIPIAPSMTRYLVAHEYGHQVDSWINFCLDKHFNFLDEGYAKMRGLDVHTRYGGRQWHLETGEIIANDFRIAVAGQEREHWPHPHCPHPDKLPQVQDYWYEKMITYSRVEPLIFPKKDDRDDD